MTTAETDKHNALGPIPPARPEELSHHGDTWTDEYNWLRDHEDEEVLAHLKAENAHAAQHTAHLGPLIEALAGEVLGQVSDAELSVPEMVHHYDQDGRKSYWYYLRVKEGLEQPMLTRMPVGLGTPPDPWSIPDGEEVVLDANVEAEEGEFFRLGATRMSQDGRLLAWLADRSGQERYTLTVTDMVTGAHLDEPIENVSNFTAWAGVTHVFYTCLNASRRSHKVMRHRIGTPVTEDVEVHAEDDESFTVSVRGSRCGRWVLMTSGSPDCNETRILSSSEPEGEFRVITERTAGLKYRVDVTTDRLILVHNANGPDFELAHAPLEATRADQWRTLLPHHPGRRLLRCDSYDQFLVLSLRDGGQSAVWVYPRTSTGSLGNAHPVRMPDELADITVAPGPNRDDTQFRLLVTSFVTPPTTYSYDVPSNTLRKLKSMALSEHPAHEEYDPARYEQRREWAVAEDGTKVPISVVKHGKTGDRAPTLLYVYGAYERAIEPSFDLMRIAALDRGFVYAVAHVRGGGELGREWHEAGRLLTKETSFTDLVACAKHLVEAGIADPERIALEGSSAGGLVVGVVANSHPEMFRAIIADVPFVDPLTTELDPMIPGTVKDWQEFGDPLHDKDVYDLMKVYSPYQNVQEAEYPAILATAAVSDTRVSFAEPVKWLARLRTKAKNSQDRPLLVKVNVAGGHAGSPELSAMTGEHALRMAWAMDQIAPDLAWQGLEREAS